MNQSHLNYQPSYQALQQELERLRKRVTELEQLETDYRQKIQETSQNLDSVVDQAVEKEKAFAAIVNKIRRSLDLNTMFQTTTQEVRQLLKADRVGIYKFNEDWSGKFIVDSVAEKGVSLLQKQLEYPELTQNISECTIKNLADPEFTDTYLQQTEGGFFKRENSYRVCHNINQAQFSSCYLDKLKKYGVQAYLIVAIYYQQKLWGLLACYQNNQPRQWTDSEINFLLQISVHLGVAIQQAEILGQEKKRSLSLKISLEEQLRKRSNELAKEAQRERALYLIVDRIRRSLDLETIFQIATDEVRRILNVDRVAVFKFLPESKGHQGIFISESLLLGLRSTLGSQVQDNCFGDNYVHYYLRGKILAITDIYQANLSPCHLHILEHFQIRANLVVPLIKGQELWGLFCIHQCKQPRQWQTSEIEFVSKIGIQLCVALQEVELFAQAQNRSEELQKALAQVEYQKEQLMITAEWERTLAKVIESIRQTLDIETIFKSTTEEMRLILHCDRVAVYRFLPDWSGEFMFESMAEGCQPLIHANMRTVWLDTYLQETQGGRYRNHEYLAVEDIYTIGHQPCHIELLEMFQIRAYMVVPVFAGEKLWGLLAAYQNTGTRHWKTREINLLNQVGNQLGVAVQQAELLEQTKQQSSQLRTTVADLNAIVDNLGDGLLVIDIQNCITRFNPAFLALFNLEGVTPGLRINDALSPKLTQLITLIKTHKQDQVTVEIALDNGRFGQASASSILKEGEKDEGQQCLGITILIRDVTLEKEVNQMKTDFIATVSHELRTPLTSVLGFASIIQDKLDDLVIPALSNSKSSSPQKIVRHLKQIKDNVDIIVSEAERLTTLINDVLDISKMEAGAVEWEKIPADPLQILNRAIAATSSLFEKSPLTFIPEFPPSLPQVLVDPDRIIQVLINLISNAFKFTECGSVTCRAKVEKDELIVSVIDTGIGIAPQDRSKVFERFRQVGNILTDKPKGTGLGLPICQQIIEHHNGRIWVESELGKGSNFSFALPLSKNHNFSLKK